MSSRFPADNRTAHEERIIFELALTEHAVVVADRTRAVASRGDGLLQCAMHAWFSTEVTSWLSLIKVAHPPPLRPDTALVGDWSERKPTIEAERSSLGLGEAG